MSADGAEAFADSARPARVALLHVGGTIGMTRRDRVWVPDAAVLDRTLHELPQLRHPAVPRFDLHRLTPLLDSADMRPSDWERVAGAVESRYAEYDGFVILHGTDTLAYTASALSFLLPGLAKPVILTGAQLSLEHVRSDGREHLVTALLLAGLGAVPEVCVYFGGLLLRGNRAQKVSAEDFIAFESGNLPPLARVGASIRFAHDLIRPPGEALQPLRLVKHPEVIAVRVYPGLRASLLERILAPPCDAAVLETYGTGNFPSGDPELLSVIERATARGVVVVNCSQCHRGAVHPRRYGTGAALAAAGVVSGADLTPEAALTKLYCLLAAGRPPEEVRARVGADLAGEITPTPLTESEDTP